MEIIHCHTSIKTQTHVHAVTHMTHRDAGQKFKETQDAN